MITPAALPGRPPPRPTGIAPFVPPVLAPDASARYQARCEALGRGAEAPIPDGLGLPIDERANIYPMMPVHALRDLAADIKAHGLNNPVVVHEGKLIDGRNRLAACLLAGVAPRFEAWAGRGGTIEAYIESQNEHRRHLPPSVLAAIAAGRVAHFRDGPSSPSTDEAVRQAAASIPGAGWHGTRAFHQAAQKVPEVLELGRRGDLGVEEAKRLGRMPAEERTKAIAAIKAGAPASEVVPPAPPRPRQPPLMLTPPPPPPKRGKPGPLVEDKLDVAERQAGRAAVSHLDNATESLRLAAGALTSPAFRGERSRLEDLETQVQTARDALRTRAKPGATGGSGR